MPDWNPSVYLQFERQRTQPCIDLVARIPLMRPRTVVDLGCGPGNSTAVLAEHYPEATISAIDTSAAMIERAKQSHIRAEFAVADIADFAPAAPVDLIFSNASLQWVPDHATLVPRLLSHLAPGGVFATQIPHHTASPVHTLIADAANAGVWREKIGRLPDPFAMHTPGEYYDLCAPLCATVEIWTTRYFHVLGSVGDIVSWMSGTGLRPYLAQLDDADRTKFLDAYRDRLAVAYPTQPDGRVLFPFNRLFVLAVRAGG